MSPATGRGLGLFAAIVVSGGPSGKTVALARAFPARRDLSTIGPPQAPKAAVWQNATLDFEIALAVVFRP
jgi:hypothetical protein